MDQVMWDTAYSAINQNHVFNGQRSIISKRYKDQKELPHFSQDPHWWAKIWEAITSKGLGEHDRYAPTSWQVQIKAGLLHNDRWSVITMETRHPRRITSSRVASVVCQRWDLHFLIRVWGKYMQFENSFSSYDSCICWIFSQLTLIDFNWPISSRHLFSWKCSLLNSKACLCRDSRSYP